MAALCWFGAPSRAALAVANTGQVFGSNVVVEKAFQHAISFTTGPAITDLSDITIFGFGFGSGVADFTVSIYTGGSSTGPRALLTTLAGEISPSGLANYVYTPRTPLPLAPNTTYWVVASAPTAVAPSGFSWRSTSSLAEDSPSFSGWSIGNVRWIITDAGASWTTGGNLIPQLRINTTEPRLAITTQPNAQTATSGSPVTLSVTAVGTSPPSFQWQKDGVAIPGATSSTLTLNSMSKLHVGSYTAVASNGAGSVTSLPAIVDLAATASVITPVANMDQLLATTHLVGKSAGLDLQQAVSFTTGGSSEELASITVNGSSFGIVTGLTFALYTGISAAGPTALVATLVGNSSPPAEVSNYRYSPTKQVILAANTTYWLVATAPTTDAGSAFLWRSTNSFAEDARTLPGWSIGNTRWVMVEGRGAWTSPGGALPQFSVQIDSMAPSIITHPISQTATAGGNVTLSATTAGTPGASLQWRRDGVAVPGATNSTLLLDSVAKAHAGTYTLVATNSAGSSVSRSAILEVNPASALANFSVRTAMTTGQTLIVGAVVMGAAKPILVRAAGPALNGFNLQGMVDPRMDLFTTGTLPVATNDDWGAALSATFASVGAFPFVSASKDAALFQPIAGDFTVQTRGTGAGTVLVEAYDVAGGMSARLVNFSARNHVGTGSDILIAGISLSGTGTKLVLIRAVGPGLTIFGVEGTLRDPRLQVVNSGGVVVGTNDNWESTLTPTFARLGAFSLADNSRDSALLINLAAGTTYTVQVSGADGGTGEALIEIYEVF